MSFTECHNESTGDHEFLVLEPEDPDAWIKAVSQEYKNLRTACAVPITEPIDLAGIGVLSVATITQRIARAAVPIPDLHRGSFSITRSDFSEVSAYLILENEFGTKIGYKLVRDRELINLPGRGIDAIGFEQGQKLNLILTEVKFSNENSSPEAPQVVDVSNDSMKMQHTGHLTETANTVDKLLDCARKIHDEDLRNKCLAAALYLENQSWDHFGIVTCCVLVRPMDVHDLSDFGFFRRSPEHFSPAKVRFVIVKIPGSIDQILESWEQEVNARRVEA